MGQLKRAMAHGSAHSVRKTFRDLLGYANGALDRIVYILPSARHSLALVVRYS